MGHIKGIAHMHAWWPPVHWAGPCSRQDKWTGLTDDWWDDPRLPELGVRAILPGEDLSSDAANVIYWREYRQWRIEHGVAEGSSEMPPGDAPSVAQVPFGFAGCAMLLVDKIPSCTQGMCRWQEAISTAHWLMM
jgi:hypothetical protein